MSLMRNKSFIFILSILCAAGALGTSLCQAADTVYTCPMHPQVVSDKPGNCPICGMRLVKREPVNENPIPSVKSDIQGEISGTLVPAGYASVLISPQKQQLIGIRTALVRKKEIFRSLRANARVVYDPELYQAQVDYLKEYRAGQVTLRNRESTFKNLQDSRYEAPRIDQVKSRLFQMGMDEESIRELVENTKADESLLYLKPDGEAWVFAFVSESEAQTLHKSDRVRLEVPSIPGKTYEGMIHSIGSNVDPETRRIHLHIKLKNDGFLKSEMFLRAMIDSPAGEGLAVPTEAVFLTGTAAIVFVDKGQGLFEPREVQIGTRAGDDYPILKGLAEGENVVVSGNFLLDSESKLKAALEQATARHAGHGSGND